MKESYEILKQHNIKCTPQRIAIYNLLLHSTAHPTTEEIYQDLQQTHPTISIATIYKTLEYFQSLDLIQELNLGEGRSRYDACMEPHAHLFCTTCNTVRDYFHEDITHLFEHINFHVKHHQFIVYGTCEHCML